MRFRHITVLLCAAAASAAARGQYVAYSNLGPGDSFDAADGYELSRFANGSWAGVSCAFPIERSGTLRTVELGLRHTSGSNIYRVGFGAGEHIVALPEQPGELLQLLVADEGFELVEGERFWLVVNRYWSCGPPEEPATAAWHFNGLGKYLDGPIGNGSREGCLRWFDDCECSAGFIHLEPAIRLTVLPACEADCDGSGGLDLFDFLCFFNLFNTGDGQADCDESGALDLFDFLCFVNAFNEGC